MSIGKKEIISTSGNYFQSDIFYKLKALESLVPNYEYEVDRLERNLNSIAYSGVPENKDTRLKLIQLLDECLQIRRSIRDLITSIKENLSNIKVPELENNINAKVNDLHQIVMNKDHTLRFLHYYFNPRGELLTVRDHLEGDTNPYAFYYTPPPPYQPPPPNTNQNNTNRNTGSGIRRNRRSRRGGSLVSKLFPSFLTSLALF